MKKYLLSSLLLVSTLLSFSQVTTRRLGIDSASSLPRLYFDTVLAVLPISKGGTNITTYTTGDILYASATNTLSKLAIGTAKQTLHVVSGLPAWRDTAVAGAGATWQTPGQILGTGGTSTWDLSITTNDSVTLTAANTTLSLTNPIAGMYGTLLVIQDGTGSRLLTLPALSKVINGMAGVIILSTAPGSRDILSFYYDGRFYYWTIGRNYN